MNQGGKLEIIKKIKFYNLIKTIQNNLELGTLYKKP